MLNERERLLPDWATCAYNKGAIFLETVIDKTVNVALRKFNASFLTCRF